MTDSTTEAANFGVIIGYVDNRFCSPSRSISELLLSVTFWASRGGHKHLPFSPPVRAFPFIAHRDRHSYHPAFYARQCSSNLPTVTLAFSSRQFPRNKKVPASTNVHSVRLNPTTLMLAGNILTYYPIGDADYTPGMTKMTPYLRRPKETESAVRKKEWKPRVLMFFTPGNCRSYGH